MTAPDAETEREVIGGMRAACEAATVKEASMETEEKTIVLNAVEQAMLRHALVNLPMAMAHPNYPVLVTLVRRIEALGRQAPPKAAPEKKQV